MVVRLMLSLKKTADSPGSIRGFTSNSQIIPIRFAPRTSFGGTEWVGMKTFLERSDFIQE